MSMQKAIQMRARGLHSAVERQAYRRNRKRVTGMAEAKARAQRKDAYLAGELQLCGGYEHEHIRERYGFGKPKAESGLIRRIMRALFGGAR